MNGRQDVLTTAEAVVASITPGATIGLSGQLTSTHAMAIVRELIRQEVGDLHLVGTASGLEMDMLIAAGLVRRVSAATVSGDYLRMVGPAFRREAQNGNIEVWECDEGMIYMALQAAAQMQDFAPFPAAMGASFVEINDGMEVIASPFSGKPVVAIRAIELDIAIIHASASDPFGNVQIIGGGFGARGVARAAKHIVCTAERIITNDEVRHNPAATSLPGVHEVIHAPFGSHPFAAPGFYVEDEPVIMAYIDAATAWMRTDDRGPLEAFFQEWIVGPKSHWDYLDRVGSRRLHALSEALNMDVKELA